jgi:hypothetical protein
VQVVDAPVVLLGLPNSFNSLIAAMMGRHPQLFDLPETHLFGYETLGQWRSACNAASFHMADGLLRAIAQLLYGSQSSAAVETAEGWIRRRHHFTSGFVVELLAHKVHPRRLIEQSPSLAADPRNLRRLEEMFPMASFVHLVEHPVTFGGRLIATVQQASARGVVPQWLLHLASYPHKFADDEKENLDSIEQPAALDPQRSWYALHKNLADFLNLVPESQKFRFRVEDLLHHPGSALPQLCRRMNLKSDHEVVAAMMRPDLSAFANSGPSEAMHGNDPTHFQSSAKFQEFLSSWVGSILTCQCSLPWEAKRSSFAPEVLALANTFGY